MASYRDAQGVQAHLFHDNRNQGMHTVQRRVHPLQNHTHWSTPTAESYSLFEGTSTTESDTSDGVDIICFINDLFHLMVVFSFQLMLM